MISSRCGNCTWWDRQHRSLGEVPQNLGYCRKHYPVVSLQNGRYYGNWPLTDQNDLCGEFRAERRDEVENGMSI